ncbi:MAG: NAD(P)-dependent oxidoreductase, partial [Candidatus Omnitrophica bacterium]|nr:NAD(P)-dependent oxidoreductase [Candidatus Omnitrophota bacterium]
NLGQITVLGGFQMRPNIHVNDIVDLYALLLEAPEEKISGKFFNAGCRNHSVSEIARLVRDVVREKLPKKGEIKIETLPSDDMRSYHVSAGKLKRELGFSPKRRIEDAIAEMVSAFHEGKIPNPLNDPRYYNAKLMREVTLE